MRRPRGTGRHGHRCKSHAHTAASPGQTRQPPPTPLPRWGGLGLRVPTLIWPPAMSPPWVLATPKVWSRLRAVAPSRAATKAQSVPCRQVPKARPLLPLISTRAWASTLATAAAVTQPLRLKPLITLPLDLRLSPNLTITDPKDHGALCSRQIDARHSTHRKKSHQAHRMKWGATLCTNTQSHSSSNITSTSS